MSRDALECAWCREFRVERCERCTSPMCQKHVWYVGGQPYCPDCTDWELARQVERVVYQHLFRVRDLRELTRVVRDSPSMPPSHRIGDDFIEETLRVRMRGPSHATPPVSLPSIKTEQSPHQKYPAVPPKQLFDDDDDVMEQDITEYKDIYDAIAKNAGVGRQQLPKLVRKSSDYCNRAIQQLLSQGHIYTTTDNDHFAAIK